LELNVCWNSVYRRIFGFHRFESVRVFIHGLGRLDFFHLRAYLCLKYYKKGLSSGNRVLNSVTNLTFRSQYFDDLCKMANINALVSDYRKFVTLHVSEVRAQIHIGFGTTCAEVSVI
jgi:uncharacterized protein YerC